MNQPDYRPAQRKLGRRLVLAFEVVNTFSFSLLAGNLITLLLLRLGANSTLIGILAAFPYIAFFFMPLAKGSVVKNGLVKTFGRAWPAPAAPTIPVPFRSPAASASSAFLKQPRSPRLNRHVS